MKLKLEQSEMDGRYYNGARWTEREALEEGTWFIAIIGDREFPDESELDVMARDRAEAFAVAKAALARDFEPRVAVTEMVMA